MFGGVGAIVGGVSASTAGRQRLSSLELRLLVDDTANPGHRFAFFHSQKPIATTSSQAKIHLQQIETWQVLIELLMAGIDVPNSGSLRDLQDLAESTRLKMARENGAV